MPKAFFDADALYNKHTIAFSHLEHVFYLEHGIPKEITACTIKQRLIGALLRGLPSSWLNGFDLALFSFFRFYAAMLYLLIFVMIGKSYKPFRCDVLFDYWDTAANDFYSEIVDRLPNVDKAAISPFSRIFEIANASSFSKILIRPPRFITRNAAWQVLKAHFFKYRQYRVLEKAQGISIIDLVLRLINELAQHLSAVEGLKIKALISANDNGYSPLRYHVYKSKAVEQLLLIQNGGRVEVGAHYNCYIHCDTYFGWLQDRNNQFLGMVCKNKMEVGSMRLSNFLKKQKLLSVPNRYDVVFFEQILTEGHPRYDEYLRIIENLARFSVENPGIRVAYRNRNFRRSPKSNSGTCNAIDGRILNSPLIILTDSSLTSSYDDLISTHLVAAMDSSLRCEALILNVPVISCSHHAEVDDYVVNISPPEFIIDSTEYQQFESSLKRAVNKIRNAPQNKLSENFLDTSQLIAQHILWLL